MNHKTLSRSLCAALLLSGLPLSLVAMATQGESGGDSDGESADAVAAIRTVFQEDAELSRTRNNASREAPITEAIRNYVAGLKAIDYSGTPEAVADAFEKHRKAWETGLSFLEKYTDLRAEMHALFDQVRAQAGETQERLERFEKGLFDTWDEVEAAAREAGWSP